MRHIFILVASLIARSAAAEVVLFDGNDLDAWQSIKGEEASWEISDSYVEVVPGTGDIQTKQSFGNFELNLEFWLPSEPEKIGQNRANSGVFLQGLYEIQILDSIDNSTYADGVCGALYKQIAPDQIACLPAENWQTLFVRFIAPMVDTEGKVLTRGRVDVVLNGVNIIESGYFNRPTGSRGRMRQGGPGPIVLQDHGSPVRFRNITIKPL